MAYAVGRLEYGNAPEALLELLDIRCSHVLGTGGQGRPHPVRVSLALWGFSKVGYYPAKLCSKLTLQPAQFYE